MAVNFVEKGLQLANSVSKLVNRGSAGLAGKKINLDFARKTLTDFNAFLARQGAKLAGTQIGQKTLGRLAADTKKALVGPASSQKWVTKLTPQVQKIESLLASTAKV